MNGFDTRFRSLRAAAGHTQQAAANALGVAIGTVACWESGRTPDAASAVRVAALYGVSLDWLLLGRGPKKPR